MGGDRVLLRSATASGMKRVSKNTFFMTCPNALDAAGLYVQMADSGIF